jgi:hypothetical protein
LHLTDLSTPKNATLDVVNHNTPSKEVAVCQNKKSMNMNCFRNVPARLVLYFLSWSGFLVSFMMRNDINFALVVMVKTNTTQQNSTNATESPVVVSCLGSFLRISADFVLTFSGEDGRRVG